MVILARSKDDLEETKSLINSSAPGVNVHIFTVDLGDLDSLRCLCPELMKIGNPNQHEQFILVNNAGGIDTFQCSLAQLSDGHTTQKFFDVNYTSMTMITSHFLTAFPHKQLLIIHMTSLLATVHIARFPLYCPSRAARNAYMGVLVAENPDVRVLNYSPGPCDTEMYKKIPDEIRKGFMTLLTTEESITKLVRLICEDTYKNGCVIDYYD